MGLVKRALVDILKAGIPRFRGPVIEAIEDVDDGNQNVRFVRDALRVETVNELAVERAGQVEDAMFVGKVVKAIRDDRRRKRRR